MQLEAVEPASGEPGLSPNSDCAQAAFRYRNPEARQQRTLALVRTGERSGFYFDVFRSLAESEAEQFHDYLYHNIGQSVAICDAEGNPLALAAGDLLGSRHGTLKGYDYFKKEQSVDCGGGWRAVFSAKVRDREHLMALWMTGQKSDPVSTWNVIVGLYKHHLDLGHYKNELSSSWWGWPILRKPVVVKLSDAGLLHRYSSSMGNLLFWCTVTLSMLALPISALVIALRTRLKRYWFTYFGPQVTKAALLMTLGWFTFIAPWIATSSTRGKYTFSHYYLPCYAFGLIMLAGFGSYIERKRPRWIVEFIGVALVVSIYYAPVWGEFAMSSAAANHRFFVPAWRP